MRGVTIGADRDPSLNQEKPVRSRSPSLLWVGSLFSAFSQTQVADRWHLIENASAAFLDVVRQHMRTIREVLASNALDPSVLTRAERRQWNGFQRRQETTEAVLALTRAGTPIKAVLRQLSLARMTARRIVRGGGMDMFRTRISTWIPISRHSMPIGVPVAAMVPN